MPHSDATRRQQRIIEDPIAAPITWRAMEAALAPDDGSGISAGRSDPDTWSGAPTAVGYGSSR
jgi:hypothetical protein